MARPESMLAPEAWQTLLTDNPAFADLEIDVEALLVNRREEGFEAFGVPIDVCYELVGLVRLYWKGFDGGTDVWNAINALLDQLRQRGEPIGADHA